VEHTRRRTRAAARDRRGGARARDRSAERHAHDREGRPADPPASASPRVDDPAVGDSQRTVAFLVGGVGIVGVVVGSVFGLVSISRGKDADKECQPPDYNICTAKGVEAGSAAMSAGNVSTVAFVAGGVLVAGGVVLYLTAPSGARVAIAPSVTHHSASLGLSTRF
jgi:hypothetical protein